MYSVVSLTDYVNISL